MDRSGSKGIGFIVDNYNYAMNLAKTNKQVLKSELDYVDPINLSRVMEILTGWANSKGSDGTAIAQEELNNILKILASTNSTTFHSGQEAGRYIHNVQEVVNAIEEIRAGISSRVSQYRNKVDAYNTNLSKIKEELNK